MKPEGPAKHFILAFLLALVGYVVFYQSIEHRRTRNGPWRVTFTRGSAGVPTIVINQPRLAITNVQIRFPGETLPATNSPLTLAFGQPRPVPYEVPFGKCVFMDTTFLPGTLAFQLFGHEIEMLPRVLVIDRQEHSWRPDATIALPRGQAAPAEPKPSTSLPMHREPPYQWARQARLNKKVTARVVRHSFVTPLVERGTDMKAVRGMPVRLDPLSLFRRGGTWRCAVCRCPNNSENSPLALAKAA